MNEQTMTDRTLRSSGDLDALTFDDRGLIPVVAQDAATGTVRGRRRPMIARLRETRSWPG